jgi:4'-phosphopantetheinyl transferase
MLQLECFDVSVLSEQDIACLYEAASSERRDRADRLKQARDRACCLVAEALLRRALRRCGKDATTPVLQDEWGKPYVPISEFSFNISHGGHWVALVYSRTAVGVDVETVEDSELRRRLARRYFTPKEQTYAFENADGQIAHRIARLWTAKESYVKYLGRGLRVPLSSFDVDAASGCVYDSEGRLLVPRLGFAMLDDAHVLCVCAEQVDFVPTVISKDELLRGLDRGL